MILIRAGLSFSRNPPAIRQDPGARSGDSCRSGARSRARQSNQFSSTTLGGATHWASSLSILRPSMSTTSNVHRPYRKRSPTSGKVVTRLTSDIEALQELLEGALNQALRAVIRSDEHTSELQSLMRISYAVFCLKKQILR